MGKAEVLPKTFLKYEVKKYDDGLGYRVLLLFSIWPELAPQYFVTPDSGLPALKQSGQ